MKSKPGTFERLKEMVEFGHLNEGNVPEELVSHLAQQIADEVDRKIIEQIRKDILGS